MFSAHARLSTLLALAAVFSGPPARAQDAAAAARPVISSPVLGYLFDTQSAQIRAIGGVPGASWLDDAVPSDQLADAVVAPRGAFGFVRVQGGESAALAVWSSGKLELKELPNVLNSVDRVVFSSTGETMALWSEAAGKIQVWGGLPRSPALVRERDYDAAVSAWAVSDDGSLLALVRDKSVLLFSTESDTTLTDGGSYTALAFRPGSHELAIADSEQNAVLWADESGTVARLADQENGIKRPTALAFTRDRDKLAVVSRGNHSAALISLESRLVRLIACSCEPDALLPVSGNGVFRLQDGLKTTVWMLDGDADEPRIVPLPVSTASQNGEQK